MPRSDSIPSNQAGPPELVVEDPGGFTTIQDLGRVGLANLGVPRAGAADTVSLRLANALVGNPPGAAGLESTWTGPTLAFAGPTLFAACGAPAPMELAGRPVPFGACLVAEPGWRLRLGPATEGLRSYLAFAGGIEAPSTLSSRSTDTLGGLGPPPLLRGDRLRLGPAHHQPVEARGWLRQALLGESDPAEPLLAMPGPRCSDPSDPVLGRLCSASWTVDPLSDRAGLRLQGPRLALEDWPDLSANGVRGSMGMVAGAVQLPPSGQPIVLLANHGTTGGYPVIAVLARAEQARLSQLRPGSTVRFRLGSEAQARQALARQESALLRAVVRLGQDLLL